MALIILYLAIQPNNFKYMENNKNEKKEVKMRQIIIETDGNNINLIKADVAGNLELFAILSTILNKLNIK